MPTTPRLTAELVTRTDLRQVRTPPGTRTWQPLPHATLLDQVCHWLARCGYQITSESHTLGSGDQHYFGVLDVTTDQDGPDYQAAIGVRSGLIERPGPGDRNHWRHSWERTPSCRCLFVSYQCRSHKRGA